MFFEKIVKRKLTGKDKTVLVSVIAISAVFGLLGAVYLGIAINSLSLGFLALAAVIYLNYRVLSNLFLEYEYAFTSDKISGITLDFDCVIAGKKRRRVISVDLKEAQTIAPYEEKHFEQYGGEKNILFLGSSKAAAGQYFIAVPSKEGGRVIIIFEPGSEMVEAMKEALPRKVTL